MATIARPSRGVLSRIAPSALMMVLPPIFTEWLLGGTRLSAIIGFPPIVAMEIIVWGGGALMLRALARKLGLGWGSLILFGLVIAVAEEFVIQQTSFAPLVIKLKGVEWGRAGGINYVYALWALVYEAVWVVLMPTLVAEMVFADRRNEPWLSKTGLAIVGILFPIGSLMAWYGWTHIARVQTFHLPLYSPGAGQFAGALAAIALLFVWAIRFPPRFTRTAPPPSPVALGLSGAVWSTLWFGLTLLAFGLRPELSAPAVFAAGLALTVAILVLLPRWAAHPAWRGRHGYGLFFGTLTGAMLATFVGFIGGSAIDIAFKAATNLIAFGLMILLGRKAARSGAQA
jgi:hypothetical protein